MTLAEKIFARKWVGDAIASVPPENTPTLVIEVELPDGRKLRTNPRKGILANFDASFAITTNRIDERKLIFRVFHQVSGQAPVDVGSIAMSAKDLLDQPRLPPHGSLLQLALAVEPGDPYADGQTAGLSPVASKNNRASAVSAPRSPNAVGYRVKEIKVRVAAQDTPEEALEGSPDPMVEIIQDGAVIYRSPVAQDQGSATWYPEDLFIFLEPNRRAAVRLYDEDISDHDIVLNVSCPFTADKVHTYRARGGSYVQIRTEARQVGP